MGDPGGAAQAQEGERTAPAQGDGLLMLPPRVLVRPWWFPAEDLEDPLVFYLEAWLADQIFGPELEILPEIQWMSQALLSVNTVKSGTFVEISVFGRPRVQLHVKSVILSLALRHKEHRAAGNMDTGICMHRGKTMRGHREKVASCEAWRGASNKPNLLTSCSWASRL